MLQGCSLLSNVVIKIRLQAEGSCFQCKSASADGGQGLEHVLFLCVCECQSKEVRGQSLYHALL